MKYLGYFFVGALVLVFSPLLMLVLFGAMAVEAVGLMRSF